MAAPTVVAAGTFASTNVAGATLTPGLPAGWAADDLHLLLAARRDPTALTAPAGWTAVPGATGDNGSALRTEVWWRRAVAGDAAPVLTFGTGTIFRCARILGLRGGAGSGTPFAQTAAPADAVSRLANASGTLVSTTDVAPAEAATLGVFAFATATGPTSATQPAGWSVFAVARSGTNQIALGYATRTFGAAGAYGAPTTTANAAGVNDGLLLALRGPAAGGPATQRWTGSAWTPTTVQRWTGSAWVPATVKRWNGSSWV